jgi:hypothetical protein
VWGVISLIGTYRINLFNSFNQCDCRVLLVNCQHLFDE